MGRSLGRRVRLGGGRVSLASPAMSPLVGRADALDAARAGLASGAAVSIVGPMGSGRSAALDRIVDEQRADGARVVRAEASLLDRSVGLGVVRRLLLPLVADDPDLLVGGLAGWAAPLFAEGTGEVDHVAISTGLGAVMERVGEHDRVVLAIDDLDRSDPASVRVLAALRRTLVEIGGGLAYTRAPAGPGDVEGLASLDAAASLVELVPLDAAALAELAEATLGSVPDASFVAEVAAIANGLPGLAVPLLDAAAARGLVGAAGEAGALAELAVPSLPAQVRARLEGLGPAPRSLVEALAVLGDDARVDVVGAAAGLTPEGVAGAMASLVDRGLLAAGSRVRWASPLLARAARQLVGDGSAGAIAARAARAMHDAGDPPSQVGALLMAAAPVGELWAAGALAGAAAEAEARGAPEVAKALWLRQMDEPLDFFGRGWATAAVARCELHLGEPSGLRRLQELAPIVPDAALRARVRFAAGRAALWQGDARAGATSFAEAAADAVDAGEGQVALRSQAGEVLALAIGVLGDEELAAAVGALPPADGTPGGSSILGARSLAAELLGRPAAEVASLARAALADARLYVLPTSDFTAVAAAATALAATAGPSEAVVSLDRVLAEARAIGQASTIGTVEGTRAVALLAGGHLDDASDAAESALGSAHANPIELPAAAAVLADVHRLRGDLDAADEALARCAVAPEVTHPRLGELRWLAASARLALAHGDHGAAARTVARIDARGSVGGHLGAPELGVWAMAMGGRVSEANAAAAQLVVAAEHLAPAVRGRRLVLAGRLAGEVATVDAGVALLEEGGDPVALAEALAAAGDVLAHAGQRVDARERYRLGLDLADRLGAAAVADRCAEGLRLVGGRARRRALQGVEALTPAELRTCRLVADGRSNREVSEQLFVSRKTVEYHLGNAYQKLGITQRAELAGALRG